MPRRGPRQGKRKAINLYRLSKKLETEESAIQFCQDVGILPRQVHCPNCNSVLDKLYAIDRGHKNKYFKFQCNRKDCRRRRNQVVLRHGTWFSKSKLSFRKTILLTYCFIKQLSYDQTVHETSISPTDSDSDEYLETSSETISDWFSYCREVCIHAVEQHAQQNGKIGGRGCTVEINECKFGKRKYQI